MERHLFNLVIHLKFSIQKIMLDEKMKIAKLETTSKNNNNDLNENNICKIIKEIRL